MPYLKFKNSKRTSKCQSILFYSTRNFFLEKVSKCQKIGRGTLWDFSTSILAQNSKKLSDKKSRIAGKNRKGDPLVSSGIVCYAGNLFGSVSWANRGNIKFCRTFCRTILVTSGVSKKNEKKTLTKSHDWSRLFSRKAPTKKGSSTIMLTSFGLKILFMST